MAKRGTMPTYSLGVIMRLLGALGMAVVGLISGAPALIAVAFMQLLYQANPFARLAQPAPLCGSRRSPPAWPTDG